MRTFGILIIVVGIAICLVQGFPADDGEDKKGKHDGHSHDGSGMQCMGANVTIPADMKTKLQGCMDKTKSDEFRKLTTDEEKKKYINAVKYCPEVCGAQALGLFDTDGKPVKDKMEAFSKDFFPAVALTAVNAAVNDCLDKHSKTLVLKEGDCSSYNDLHDCLRKGLMTVCRPDLKVPT